MKLYKFIYDLGVKQERQRIKNELLKLQREVTGQRDFNMGIYSDSPNSKKADELKRQLEIDDQVLIILSRLTSPRAQYIEERPAIIDEG